MPFLVKNVMEVSLEQSKEQKHTQDSSPTPRTWHTLKSGVAGVTQEKYIGCADPSWPQLPAKLTPPGTWGEPRKMRGRDMEQ